MTLISPGDCTLQCGMWLWNFRPWQWIHQVAAFCNVISLIHASGMTCRWIRMVAALCNVAGGCRMTWCGIWPIVCRIGIQHLVSILTISLLSTCHSAPVCKLLSKLDHPQQKKMMSCRFSRWRISAILDFRGPIMGSLKSLCTTSYRSSIKTIALNCLVFWENLVFAIWWQTDRRTDGHTRRMKPLSLSQAAA